MVLLSEIEFEELLRKADASHIEVVSEFEKICEMYPTLNT